MRCSKNPPLWDLSLFFSCWHWHMGKETTVMFYPPVCDSNSALPSWLCSFPPKESPTLDFLPPIPSDHLPTVNSSPHFGIALPSPHSSSQSLWVMVDSRPCLRPGATSQITCVTLTRFRLSQTSCSTLCKPLLLPFCANQLPQIQGSVPCFSSPTPRCRFCPTCSPPPSPLFPLSYRVVHGSIYSFPIIRDSCQFSVSAL